MKIWRGDACRQSGEQQLLEHLDHYHLEKGYMINFNKEKSIGVKELLLDGKVLVEAVV